MEISSIGLSGLNSAALQFQKAGAQIARGADAANPTDAVDLSSAAVALTTSKESFAANLKVIDIADEMSQTALNIMA